MYKLKVFFSFFLAFFFFVAVCKQALAVKFDLIPPSGELKRGDNIDFTINIDSQGATINTAEIGMTYDTQYLQYINTVPGETMTSVGVTDQGGGKLLLSGNNASGFSGQGVFATVTLQIIASSSGSTELCVLWAPTPAPTTFQPTSPPVVPTALPATGNINNAKTGVLAGFTLLVFAGCFYFFSKKIA